MPSEDTFADKTGLPMAATYALRASPSAAKTAPLYAAPSAPETWNVTAEVALQWPGVDVAVGVAAGDGVGDDCAFAAAVNSSATTLARADDILRLKEQEVGGDDTLDQRLVGRIAMRGNR